MKKMKKIIILLVVVLILAGAASGGVYAYQKYQKENWEVEAVLVANINSGGWWGDSMTSSGIVSNNQTQSVLLEDKTVRNRT